MRWWAQLRTRTKIVICAVIWATSVVLFSFVYWMFWMNAPDSFILNREFNLTPYDYLSARLWEREAAEGSKLRAPESMELYDMTQKVSELDLEIRDLDRQIIESEIRRRKIEARQQSAFRVNSNAQEHNIAEYRENATAEHRQAVDAATDKGLEAGVCRST